MIWFHTLRLMESNISGKDVLGYSKKSWRSWRWMVEEGSNRLTDAVFPAGTGTWFLTPSQGRSLVPSALLVACW